MGHIACIYNYRVMLKRQYKVIGEMTNLKEAI